MAGDARAASDLPILSRFRAVRRDGDGWRALCPAHADKNPSLSIDVRDSKILLHCHAGCSTEAVLAAAGIEKRALFLDASNSPRIMAQYSYTDERGELLFQVVRREPKSFRQRRPDGSGGWTWNLRGVRLVLYGLPEVLAGKSVIVCEGEKDSQTARRLGLVATCNPGGAGKWREEYAQPLRGKRVVVIADADEAGRKHAQQVAESLAGKAETLKVVELPGAKDLSEWLEHDGTREALLEIIRNAPEWKPQSVERSAVLNALVAYIRRFVCLSELQARVAALWVVHTHAFAAADATPYLAVCSPEKRSGKTRLLEVLDTLTANPWYTGRVTAAVLIRKIAAEQPTLLLDEGDAAFSGEKEYAEALRGVLNTGHRRGGKASCCVGQGANMSFRDFSTFCPKAIAGIGKLPDTVADRAIPVRLKRAAPGEVVERFRRRNVETEAMRLRGQVEALCTAIAVKLRDARTELPQELTDRQQDGAEPLLAIADAVGGEWPQVARQALVELCSEGQASDDSAGVRLLTDIRQIFEARGVDRLPSAELAGVLAEIETSPWGEWSHGKPLTASRLARLLRPFGIVPHTIRTGESTHKGYEREDFEDAWIRYVRLPGPLPGASPGPQTVTRSQPFTDAGSSDFSKRNSEAVVTVQKSEIPNKNGPCDGVTLSTSATEGERGADNLAPCGLPHCAGCYDVGDNKKIHPPKCGQDYLDWHKRWEAESRVQ